MSDGGERVMDLERLDEALESGELERVINGMDIAGIHPSLKLLCDAARAYRDLLASGGRVEPDYEVAEALFEPGADLDWLNDGKLAVDVLVRKIVDAAVGDKLLSDYPKEAENE